MKITFVMGIACSGKSTYISENFKDRKIIDLYDFQENKFTYQEIYNSYIETENALIKAIKNGEDVVLEHTLLKGIRRKMYIDAVREITDEPIEIILINPEIKTMVNRRAERFGLSLDIEPNCFEDLELQIKEELSVLEIPTEDEGFSNVTIIYS